MMNLSYKLEFIDSAFSKHTGTRCQAVHAAATPDDMAQGLQGDKRYQAMAWQALLMVVEYRNELLAENIELSEEIADHELFNNEPHVGKLSARLRHNTANIEIIHSAVALLKV